VGSSGILASGATVGAVSQPQVFTQGVQTASYLSAAGQVVVYPRDAQSDTRIFAPNNGTAYILVAGTTDTINLVATNVQANGKDLLLADGSEPSTGEQAFQAGIKTEIIQSDSEINIIAPNNTITIGGDAGDVILGTGTLDDEYQYDLPPNNGDLLVGNSEAGTFVLSTTTAITIVLANGTTVKLATVTG
jgi:hypothetical protein